MSTSPSATASSSARVLILAPRGKDSPVLAASMREVGIDAVECQTVALVCAGIDEGAGALLVTHEGLTSSAQSQLLVTLSRQPAWSAMPVVILTLPTVAVKTISSFLAALGPVGAAILVERPIAPSTLQSVLRMALLSRERQYQLRGYLDEINRQGVELAQHRDNLQSLVDHRTAELAVTMRKAQDAQRLAALGNMAAGIGHDIANMTLPIRALLEPLAASCASAEARADIASIGKSLDHLSNLSAGLRLMALDPTRDNASAVAGDLVEWAEQADGVLRNALPRGIAFELSVKHFDRPLGVAMPSHRLTQAIFNLVQNAGEAIAATGAADGRVRIEVRPAQDSAEQATRPVVEILVSDNGPGIAPENLTRIFEPYFTTKGRTIATGMGLGMVRGLIESAGGHVRVDSQPGRGAAFTLTLPSVARSSPQDRTARRHTAALAVTDPRQRSLIRAILAGLDVEVVTGVDGALPGTPIDLWITSVDAAPPPFTEGKTPAVCHVHAQDGLATIRDAVMAAVRGLPAPASATA